MGWTLAFPVGEEPTRTLQTWRDLGVMQSSYGGGFLSQVQTPQPVLCTPPLPPPAGHSPREGTNWASFPWLWCHFWILH